MLNDYSPGLIPEVDPARRVAYAAPSGVDPIDIASGRMALYSELLSHLVVISVCGSSTVPPSAQRFGVIAQWVSDPTMPFMKEEYIDQLGLREEPSGEVFAYTLTHTLHEEELARQIAESHYATYHLFVPRRHWTKRGQGLEACVLPPVERQFERILNVQCVVTSPFHGVVFSPIFDKPSVTIVDNHDGCNRFGALVKLSDLEHYQEGAYELVSSPKCYDVRVIAQTLVRYRITSIGFLESALY